MAEFISKLKLFLDTLKSGDYINAMKYAGELVVKFSEVMGELSELKVFACSPEQEKELTSIRDEVINVPIPIEGAGSLWVNLIPVIVKMIEKFLEKWEHPE